MAAQSAAERTIACESFEHDAASKWADVAQSLTSALDTLYDARETATHL